MKKFILMACIMFGFQTYGTLGATQDPLSKHPNQCVICNKESTFRAYGIKKRDRAQCPHCYSLERHRTLCQYLKNHTNLFKDTLSVLHFSPNPIIAKILSAQPNLDYYTSDLQGNHVRINLDITDIKLPYESFDIIICYHVLEHIVEDRIALLELHRILKPTGYALIQVPYHPVNQFTLEDKNVTSPKERLRLYGQSNHVRYYGQADFEQRLTESGFTWERADTFVQELGDDVITRNRLCVHPIYKCYKSMPTSES